MAHRIVVSIINYKTGPMTIACVQSVLESAGEMDLKVVVVDNLSGDGSADEIAQWIETAGVGERVRLVRSATNSGFSGGHNQGINGAEGHYYLVLNSDAIVRPSFFSELSKVIDENPEAGLIAPRLEGDDGVVQVSSFRFHSPLGELIRGANTGPITKLFSHRDVPLGEDPDLSKIEWVSFACVLLSAKMIDQIGEMDEGYFLYFEDSEYCLRARRAGWSIARAPEAVAVHYRGGSGPVKAKQAAKARLPAYFYQSRSRFLFQAYGRLGLLWANVLWHLGRGIAHTRRLMGKPVPTVNESEARDIWINAFTPLATDNPGQP